MHFFVYAKNPTHLEELCSEALTMQHQQSMVFLGTPDAEHIPCYIEANDLSSCQQACQAYDWPITPTAPAKIALLFTGQGAQYPFMAYDLYQTLPLFKHHVEACCLRYENLFDASLFDVLYQFDDRVDDHPIHQTRWTQPTLFAIEYAMAKTWQALGLKIEACMGHSVGEYAAATVANMMSLEAGIHLIGQRGIGMQALPSKGAMAAFMADETTMSYIMNAHPQTGMIDIAALNGPKQTVLSGDQDAIIALMRLAKAHHNVRSRALTVSHAFHSAHMSPMLGAFSNLAETITYTPAQASIRIISNVTGDWMDDAPSADYWSQHIRQPVRFLDGIQTLLNDGYNHFLEVGPQPILCGMAAKSSDQTLTLMASCKRHNGLQTFYQTMGQLFVQRQLDPSALQKHFAKATNQSCV